MDGETETTETTSLLPRLPERAQLQRLPAILPTVRRFRPQGMSASDLCPDTLQSEEARTAFSLIVLLQFCTGKDAFRADARRDVWDNWSSIRDETAFLKEAEGHILDVWARFLQTYRSSADIETTLWMKFPLENDGQPCTRVMDYLLAEKAPQGLLTHPMLELSVMNTWKHGFSLREAPGSRHSTIILRRFDTLSTPRVLHAIDLAGQLVFLVVLAQYLLYPPRFVITLGVSEQGPREVFLTVMSAASLGRSWSRRTIPSILVFLAFILRLPAVPLPGDLSFTTLHLAFYIQFLLFHLPDAPGLVFVFNPEHTLSLSSLLLYGLTRIFLPVLVFFLPALFLTTLLLSSSLADTFFTGFNLSAMEPTPMDTRLAFLSLFATELVLLLIALGTTTAMFRSFVSTQPCGWDRYSGAVGIRARKAFIRALATYGPYAFPPPFNIAQIILIQVPAVALHMFGEGYATHTQFVERALWRFTVGWIGVMVAGIWWWGLL